MRFTMRQKMRLAWAAIAAVFFAAIAPGISYALAADPAAASWARVAGEVCSTGTAARSIAGLPRGAADKAEGAGYTDLTRYDDHTGYTDGTGRAAGSDAHRGHCPLCLLEGATALLETGSGGSPAPVRGDERVPYAAHAVDPPLHWPSAKPRAPPAPN